MFDARVQLANIPEVAAQTARMVRAMRAWPATAWQRATYCPDWTAADAIAHLATGADFYAQVITSGRSGEPLLPWGVKDGAEMRQVRLANGRKLIEAGAAALVDGFEREAAMFQEAITSLQEAELARTAWHPRGLVPIGSWIGMRLNELVIHNWDVRQPHEAKPYLDTEALPGMMRFLPEMQWQLLSQRLPDGLDGVHVFQGTNTAWAFHVQGTTVTYVPEAPVASDTQIRGDDELLILLTMGRSDVETALQSGALALTGDAAQGRQVCDTLFRSF